MSAIVLSWHYIPTAHTIRARAAGCRGLELGVQFEKLKAVASGATRNRRAFREFREFRAAPPISAQTPRIRHNRTAPAAAMTAPASPAAVVDSMLCAAHEDYLESRKTMLKDLNAQLEVMRESQAMGKPIADLTPSLSSLGVYVPKASADDWYERTIDIATNMRDRFHKQLEFFLRVKHDDLSGAAAAREKLMEMREEAMEMLRATDEAGGVVKVTATVPDAASKRLSDGIDDKCMAALSLIKKNKGILSAPVIKQLEARLQKSSAQCGGSGGGNVYNRACKAFKSV